ncbi:MAG: tetratricopeptide repeat-containing glycosyltransferase family protein [Candidatus Babeliales bacterium]
MALGVAIFLVVGTSSRHQNADESLYPRKDYSQDVGKIYHDLGCWQAKRKDYKRAIKTFSYALQESPDSLDLYDQLGRAYECDGNKTRAFKTYIRAIARNQHFSDVRFGCYEDDVYSGDQGNLLLGSSEVWKGQTVPNKSLLVYTPESDADTVMFLRFIPDVARKVGRVVLVAKPSLVRICKSLKHCTSNLEVIDTSSCLATLPQCHCHVALSQVPAYLNYTYQNVPGRAAYLKPDQAVVKKFHDAVFAKDISLKIGIALDASKNLYRDINVLSSLVLDQLIKCSGVMFYFLPTLNSDKDGDYKIESIVHHIKISELKNAGKCVDVRNLCRDWVDVAAILAHCDVVIGLDNTVMHLAGALGKKAIMLLPEVADWRWMCYSEGESSVWYKSITKICKKESTPWDGLVSRALKIALAADKKQAVKF